MPQSCIVCDLETTGLNPYRDEIIEIALLQLEEGRITREMHTLVRPRRKIPVNIRRLTGLDDAALGAAPYLEEILPEAIRFIGPHPLMGHNISFDAGFLQAAHGRTLDNPLFDTRELARILLPGARSYRLSDLCRLLEIEMEGSHRALWDARAAAALYSRLMARAAQMEGKLLLHLAGFLTRAGSPWAEEMGQLAWQSRHTRINDRVPFRPSRVEEEAEPPRDPNIPADPEQLCALLEPGGPLATHLEKYEYRPQQKKMVAAIAGALAEEKYLLLEAGTGTGKSLAYLIPALQRSLKTGQRAVVSTHTINLQEQLWQKDIPLVKKALGWPFRAALVKGRQNYLCLRRWLHSLTVQDWTAREAAFYGRILVWARETTTGDKNELNLTRDEQELWLSLCADGEACQGTGCRWFSRECYVTRSRRLAEAANLVVVNHSLLLSDIRAENRVLPAYGCLIIDEAHHLEDAATEQLGLSVSRSGLSRWLNTLNRLLGRLSDVPPGENSPAWPALLQQAQEGRQRAGKGVELFFNTLQQLVVSHGEKKGEGNAPRHQLRLRPGSKSDLTNDLQGEYGNLRLYIQELLSGLEKINSLLEDWSEEEIWAGHARDLSQVLSTGRKMAGELDCIMKGELDNHVYWVEVERGKENAAVILRAAPVQVNTVLYEHLYKDKKAIIFTSATLSVEESFDHFMERAGLNLLPAGQVMTMQVDSPFSYESQSLLCVVRDLPLPGEGSGAIYSEALAISLLDLAEITGGRMLVLFTSHQMLQETYNRLKPVCEERDILLLGHNLDGSRWNLVEEFRTTTRAILFGASSFWEGVDIPGPALSCVVMVKLPFWSPGVPVIEARLEELARQGKDGFRHFSLPQAIIRFKQGFGRLIRTEQDRGVVVVLDGRLLTKKYGRQFLNSLPLKSHIRGDMHLITRQIARWFNKESRHVSK
ncbi:MAG: DEAD/DEAH box helicase [Thermoanaerobacteraceae bacterium]|nr:DEAD/DEAH box helicase [Thermoanaerobacteraceae bacterium]